MRKLSEVCKIVGVTRAMLQRYDDIGLLCPTATTDSGYWLYDDDAIGKLMLIQIFREAGYERKEIKSMLDASSPNLDASLNRLISDLEEKRKRIDGMINSVKTYRLSMQFARDVMGKIKPEDIFALVQNRSFKDCWDKSVETASDFPADEEIDFEATTAFGLQVLKLGFLSEKPVEDPEVKACVDSLVECFGVIVDKIYDNAENVTDEEVSEMCDFFNELVDSVLSIPEYAALLEKGCNGENPSLYIKKAINHYYDALMQDNQKRNGGQGNG